MRSERWTASAMSSSSSTTSTRGSRVKPLTAGSLVTILCAGSRRAASKGAGLPMAATKTSSSRRKPAAKRKPSGARRSPSKRRTSSPGLRIEQRHFDLMGLGLVALAVFLGFVIYRDRDGGEAGRRAVEGLEWLLGDMTNAVPPALVAIGAILVLRPVLPAVRPFRAG